MKLDLLTNATVVDDAIRFVSSHNPKENHKPDSSSDEDESNEPDYDEDKGRLEEEQEEKTEEVISSVTTNQVF
jgi:hypothetical protein